MISRIDTKNKSQPILAQFSSFKPPQEVVDALKFRKRTSEDDIELLESSTSGVQYSGVLKKRKIEESTTLKYAVGILDKATNKITLHPIEHTVDLDVSLKPGVSETNNDAKYKDIFGATKQQKKMEREKQYSTSTSSYGISTKPIRGDQVQRNKEAKTYLPEFTDFKTNIRANVFPLSQLIDEKLERLPIDQFTRYLNFETTLEDLNEEMQLSSLTQYLLKDFYKNMLDNTKLIHAISFIHFATTSYTSQSKSLVFSVFDSDEEPPVLKTKMMIRCIILALHITGFTFSNMVALVNTFKISEEKLIDILRRTGFSATQDGEIKLKAPFGRGLVGKEESK